MTTKRPIFPLALFIALSATACDEGGSNGDDASAETKGEDSGGPVDTCETRPDGAYGNCGFADPDNPNDISVCGGSGAMCLEDFPGKATAAVCVFDGCEADCDCPAAPGSGTSEPVCAEVMGSGVKQCHLPCSEGQACPDEMFCYGGFICAFPEHSGGTPYGDCINNDAAETCGLTQQCILDDEANPMAGVCGEKGCETEENCPPAPEGGNAPVLCAPVSVGNGVRTCHLDCSTGQTCPTGMTCLADAGICIWSMGGASPEPEPTGG